MKKMNKAAGSGRLSRREPYRLMHYDELPFPLEDPPCYRPKWSYDIYPNCNTFHELAFGRPTGARSSIDGFLYLGRGTFRETWMLQELQLPQNGTASAGNDNGNSVNNNNIPAANGYVLKTNRYHDERKFDAYAMQQSQLEAITMLVTTGSIRTMDIYGHWYVSVRDTVLYIFYKVFVIVLLQCTDAPFYYCTSLVTKKYIFAAPLP